MSGMCMGFTHHEFDFDGGSCMRYLEKTGQIHGCIFGDTELKEHLTSNKVQKIVFADSSPKETLPEGIEVIIYDHHNTGINKEETHREQTNKTAFDIMLDNTGYYEADKDKIAAWRKLVQLGDQKAEADDMDITRSLKRVHGYLGSDSQTYKSWFIPLFDSFFSNKPDYEQGMKILKDSISAFLSKTPASPAAKFMKKWSERANNKEKIIRSTQRNIIHFLAYMDKQIAKSWIDLLLEAFHNEQVTFQECKNEFKKAKLDFFGDTLVISAITANPKFVQVSRYMIFSKDEDVHQVIREKIKDRNSPWMVLTLNPKSKNFQIFVNGNKVHCQMVISELTKAIRAETLIQRKKTVPKSDILSEGGLLEGTEPLYYHNLETGYPSLLWGSLKHPSNIPATEFGSTSANIHSRLVEIIKLALDRDEYAADCNPSACQNCSIYSWQLSKCYK